MTMLKWVVKTLLLEDYRNEIAEDGVVEWRDCPVHDLSPIYRVPGPVPYSLVVPSIALLSAYLLVGKPRQPKQPVPNA